MHLPLLAVSAATQAEVVDRFRADSAAQAIAVDLLTTDDDVVDVLPAQTFDGGYRGQVRLVPALPVGDERKHLEWVAGAMHDFDWFFGALAAYGAPRYRWQGVTFHFFRSVGNTTPNAFAWGWSVAYNVHGSIDTSPDAVRETLFHEFFHLNDASHNDWSSGALKAIHDAIVARCGVRKACLAPYAPTSTVVRNGTYYAFQPGNDEREYAAEIALRWYAEQRRVLRHESPSRPSFKCGPPENQAAWSAIVSEFFAGIDLVPACAP